MTDAEARAILKEAVKNDRTETVREQREALKKLVSPHRSLYKTRTAAGWDALVDATLGDTSTTGA